MSHAPCARSSLFKIVLLLVVACSACTCSDAHPHEHRARHRLEPPSGAPKGLSQAEWGERLFGDFGCIACHSVNRVRGVGGALNGLRGQPRELANGATVVATEDYIRESIIHHDAKVVKGFEDGVAPQYEGAISQAQLDSLVRYIRGLE